MQGPLSRLLLVLVTSAPIVLCGEHILAPNSGVLVGQVGPTFGVAAYFTSNGPSASSICTLARGGDKSCNAFQPAVQAGIFMVLNSLTNNRNSTSIAVGDPNSPNADASSLGNVQQRRSPQSLEDVSSLLDHLGQEHGEVKVSSRSIPSHRRIPRNSSVSIQDIRSGDLHYDMTVEHPGSNVGRVTLMPHTQRKRTADAEDSINPNATPENVHESDGPGFKIAFATSAERIIQGSLDINDHSGTMQSLSAAMAADWAKRASAQSDGSRYIGIFGQGHQLVASLMIIPELRGYGIDQEDPNALCGPLDAFACLTNATCIFSTPHVSDSCTPLTRSQSTAPNGSSFISGQSATQGLQSSPSGSSAASSSQGASSSSSLPAASSSSVPSSSAPGTSQSAAGSFLSSAPAGSASHPAAPQSTSGSASPSSKSSPETYSTATSSAGNPPSQGGAISSSGASASSSCSESAHS